MAELEMINFNIELYRALLNDLGGNAPQALTSGKVLNLSQELDELIVKHYSARKEERRTRKAGLPRKECLAGESTFF